MDEKELKDLKIFGTNLEKPINDNIKKDSNKSSNLLIQNKPIKKISNSQKFIKISKKIFIFLLKKYKKTYEIILEKFKTFNYKRNLHVYNKVVNKDNSQILKGYRIIETCKKKGNKTIITRKRVLVPIDKQLLNPSRNNIGSLFYITFKDEDFKNTKPEAYKRLKKSVWDFPIKNDKNK